MAKDWFQNIIPYRMRQNPRLECRLHFFFLSKHFVTTYHTGTSIGILQHYSVIREHEFSSMMTEKS